MSTKGYIGIDAGTQGLSAIFTDESLNVLATGESSYEMVPGLPEGCYEQRPEDWESALIGAMQQLRRNYSDEMDVLAIGISGQMHGEVLADGDGNSLCPARLWCDARNEAEGLELTEALGVKMPKRITAARWLWTIRNRNDIAVRTEQITTPAGWIAFLLTGQWKLGIGDAAGMFPINQTTLDYDQSLLEKFDLLAGGGSGSLKPRLPTVKTAGEDGGTLNANGAAILGLPTGIPVAPAEGDQPAALAGSLIGDAGLVSCSFGTSVCANSVGDRPFKGVSHAVDHFCAPDGKPINMVWLRNGTTYMNSVVEMFGQAIGGDRSAGFDSVMPLLLKSDADCGGVMAFPFMDDEPGVGVARGGTAMLIGLNAENSTPGNVVKAALLSTMFNLRLGSENLDAQEFPRTEIILSGGLTRTPELGQILANVFATPVSLLDSAEEGTAWGAALLAKFRQEKLYGNSIDWENFLKQQPGGYPTRFEPCESAVPEYERVFQKYKKLIGVHQSIDAAVH